MLEDPRYAFLWLGIAAPAISVACTVVGIMWHDTSMIGIGVITGIWNVYVAVVYGSRAYQAWQARNG